MATHRNCGARNIETNVSKLMASLPIFVYVCKTVLHLISFLVLFKHLNCNLLRERTVKCCFYNCSNSREKQKTAASSVAYSLRIKDLGTIPSWTNDWTVSSLVFRIMHCIVVSIYVATMVA